MEEFYINKTSKDQVRDFDISSENISCINNTDYSPRHRVIVRSFMLLLQCDDHVNTFLFVLRWLLVGIGLPLTLVTIFAVCTLIKADRSTPVFIINLLISNLIHLCCQATRIVKKADLIIDYLHTFSLTASVGFMVCISLERYLVIAHPLWYRFRRTVKTSVVVCVITWILALVYGLTVFLNSNFEVTTTIFGVSLLLPLPLFIFSLVGTLRALSASQGVPADEKRRIVGILVLVLLIYTLLVMPSVVWFLVKEYQNYFIFSELSFTLIDASPLADVMMYILIRKGNRNQLLASLRCC